MRLDVHKGAVSASKQRKDLANCPAESWGGGCAKKNAVTSNVGTAAQRVHPLVWILLAGGVVRVVLWFAWGSWSPLVNRDAEEYQQLATRLATVGDYADARGEPVSLRPPLYPAGLALAYRVFGVQNDAAARALQAVVGLATVILVYYMAKVVYDERVALWAAGLCGFYPSLLAYANLLLSETLFTFFVVAFCWLACEAIQRESLSTLAAAGLALGVAALTRSIMLVFAPLLSLYVLLCWRGRWSRRLLAAAIPVAVFALSIAPWSVRNTRLQQTLTFIDVMGGRNAMMGNYEHTPLERSWATIGIATGNEAWDMVLMHEDPQAFFAATQGQRDKLRFAMPCNLWGAIRP